MVTLILEFWADSFHEGNWACEELGMFFRLKSTSYKFGFIPVYTYLLNEDTELIITVYGSYKNWNPLPEKISDLLDWGKPDLIIYDPIKANILLAVEETAAIPTGNQALQRCERIYGSLRSKIPFWYLLGEFGVHIDGGLRRDSIWPTILAIKLSCIMHTPCVVLHYSDIDNPEDYKFGTGVKCLYESLAKKIEVYFEIANIEQLVPILKVQYEQMFKFISEQYLNVVKYLPGYEVMLDPTVPEKIARTVVTGVNHTSGISNLFEWRRTSEIINNEGLIIQERTELIKYDKFLYNIEGLVASAKAYTLSKNAGSRPQQIGDIMSWIDEQRTILSSNNPLSHEFTIKIEDFPPSKSGLHLTTAKNVFYLINEWNDVRKTLIDSFDRLEQLDIECTLPVFLYVSNSLKPGRIFGDPFTGQLSAFVNIFCKSIDGTRTRLSIAYYPHQVHNQLFDASGKMRKNKGITLMRELLDFAIFQGGIIVNFKTGQII